MTDDHVALVDALNRFSEKVDRFNSAGNHASARVDNGAGALGIWVCATACLVMLTAAGFLAMIVVDQNGTLRDQGRRIDDLDAYLSAIYMQAPHLKPKDKD